MKGATPHSFSAAPGAENDLLDLGFALLIRLPICLMGKARRVAGYSGGSERAKEREREREREREKKREGERERKKKERERERTKELVVWDRKTRKKILD